MDSLRGVVVVEVDHQHSTHLETTAPRVDTVQLPPTEMDVPWVMPVHCNSPPHQIQVIESCGVVTEQRSIVDLLVELQHSMDHRAVVE